MFTPKPKFGIANISKNTQTWFVKSVVEISGLRKSFVYCLVVVVFRIRIVIEVILIRMVCGAARLLLVVLRKAVCHTTGLRSDVRRRAALRSRNNVPAFNYAMLYRKAARIVSTLRRRQCSSATTMFV